MKPKPHFSVEEILQGAGKNPGPFLPYDTYPDEKASFITFAIAEEFISLPLALLTKASLRSGFTGIALEFGTTLVQIGGTNLDGLYENILLGKLRVVRKGTHTRCSVESIRISEITLL